MTIYLPGGTGLLAVGISLYLFYEYNRAKEEKLEGRRVSLNDTRQQYLHKLIEAKMKGQSPEKGSPASRSDEGESENDPSVTGPAG